MPVPVDGTLNGEIVDAVRGHVVANKTLDLVTKAEEARAQIEHEAEAGRAGIAGTFSSAAVHGVANPPKSRDSRR